MWPIIRPTPDARPGTAPDEKTEMRYPTRASEPVHRRLRVPPSPLHDPSMQELHDESSWRRETVPCVLDQVHQNGMARTRRAPTLLDGGREALRKAQRSTRCAHLSTHWIQSARLGSTLARTRSIWSGLTSAVRLFYGRRSPVISLDAGSAIFRAA